MTARQETSAHHVFLRANLQKGDLVGTKIEGQRHNRTLEDWKHEKEWHP